MFGNRDRYRQLHSRRRSRRRPLLLAFVASLLVGCAAVAVMFDGDRLEATEAVHRSATVAQLTAQDAVSNAIVIAVPRGQWVAHLPLPPEPPLRPATFSAGTAARLAGALRKNESISVALTRRGIPQQRVHAALDALGDVVNFRRSKPGDPWEADVDADGTVTRVRYTASPVQIWEARRGDAGYETRQIEVDVQTRVEVVSGTIDASLWQAFSNAGDGRLAVAFADIFAYTIDFATETQRGDRFFVAFESTWLGEERLSVGKIVAARYLGAIGEHFAFRWNDAYYDESGESVERQFLRSPLSTMRITSNYGRRFHPVLERMKLHAGVDYGAPTGTPVHAVADGTVTFSGYKGANGNLVAIRHAGGYTTYYAHLSSISSGLRVGSRVKKKQVVGKVGSTGRSTGPHLHFGMKRHGAYINPLKVDFERGAPLGRAERSKFLSATAPLRERLTPGVSPAL